MDGLILGVLDTSQRIVAPGIAERVFAEQTYEGARMQTI